MLERKFRLKYEDDTVLNVDLFSKTIDIINRNKLPIGLRTLKTFNDLVKYLNARVPFSKGKNFPYLLYNMDIVLYTDALSLLDNYWVCSELDNKVWKDVNLYTNVDEVALYGNVFAKKRNEKFYFEKRNNVDIELLCSDLLDILEVKHVKWFNYNNSACSESVVTENIGLIGLDILVLDYTTDYLLHNWLDCETFWNLVVISYIFQNDDLDLMNVNFYVNKQSNQILDMSDLYDLNKAFDSEYDLKDISLLVISNEELLHLGKKYSTLIFNKLKDYLIESGIKDRFKIIFGSLFEYDGLLNRIEVYNNLDI